MKKLFIEMFYLIFVLTFVLVSCKKEEEFDARLAIKFINLSDLMVDSLKIYSLYEVDSVTFENIATGDTTEFKEFHDVSIDPIFVINIGNIIICPQWECPKYVIDPVDKQYSLLPSGRYTFGLIDCDTTSKKIVIGLIDFSKNLHF